MSMDGPKGPGGPAPGRQVQQTDDQVDKASIPKRSRMSSFLRKVALLEEALPLLKKTDNPETGKPEQTSIGDRKIESSPGKLAENPNLKNVPADFPMRKTDNILRSMKGDFDGPDAASFENKQKLVQIKNTYLTAGLAVLEHVRQKLEATVDKAGHQD